MEEEENKDKEVSEGRVLKRQANLKESDLIRTGEKPRG